VVLGESPFQVVGATISSASLDASDFYTLGGHRKEKPLHFIGWSKGLLHPLACEFLNERGEDFIFLVISLYSPSCCVDPPFRLQGVIVNRFPLYRRRLSFLMSLAFAQDVENLLPAGK